MTHVLIRWLRRLRGGHRPIWIDFPPAPLPRWGYGRPGHAWLRAIIERDRDGYAAVLDTVLRERGRLAAIPAKGAPASGEPYWINGYLPGLDAAVLYALIASRRPGRYVEIGSGHSTRFAARAIHDHGLATRILCIDPAPRAPVERLAHELDRRRLEDMPPAELISRVGPGDILFFDGSHRAFENSDATAFFLDILPALRAGVLVQVHDVCLPYDYPPGWEDRWYSEQYLLGSYFLGGAAGARIVFPSAYAGMEPDLARTLDPLWSAPSLADVERGGSSFWWETAGPEETPEPERGARGGRS